MEKKQFNAADFAARFEISLDLLTNSEKVTKAELMVLSRSLLDALHNAPDDTAVYGDIGYINRLLAVLTPMNKKTAVLFFREFSGFTEKEGKFGKKDKKHYAAKLEAANTFLDDPLNNIWSWYDRNVADPELKVFAIDKVGKTFASLIKKADEAGFTKIDVMKQVLAQGITLEMMMALLDTVYDVEVNA